MALLPPLLPDHLSVLGFDPGGTTGWGFLSFHIDALLPNYDMFDGMQFDCGQIYGDDEQQSVELRKFIDEHLGPIVVEGFVLRKFSRDPDLLSPVRMGSRISLLAEIKNRADPFPIFEQQPSMAMATATDDRMRDWGLWTPGQPHANDAIRHCITFLRRAKGSALLRKAAWGLAA